MANKVGTKGQVVIERPIRDALGIRPGMVAIQMLVDDHVELRFVEGRHDRSLAGAARPFARRFPSDAERDALDDLWVEEVRRHLPSDAERHAP
jgi:bifunctional DNA-binding transcriptional regulator/antitoxin component of YhaV-PrlF toxin-antitoxin module